MRFDTLYYLHFLWGIPVLIGFYVYAYRRRKHIIGKFAEFETFKKLIPESSNSKTVFKPLLIVLAFSLLTFSLTGPKWGYSWEEVKRKGIDIVVAVDVSRSMLSEDIKPNRLERAKREILDLINMLQGDRFALVAFAGTSFLEAPLTLDYSAASLFLDAVDSDLIPIQGTNIGSAIDVSIKAFDKKKKTSRAIILITDGEDHDKKALDAAKKAKAIGIKIFTIGIGAEGGAPIPQPGGGFKKKSDGSVVMTKLNEKILQEIALTTGGAYVRSVSGDMDLEKIYLNEIKENMKGADLKTQKRKRYEERFQIFLLMALFLLILEFFLTTKKGAIRSMFKLTAFLLCMMPFSGHCLNLNSDTIEASDLYGSKKYKEAGKLFQKSLLADPENEDLHFNMGQNYYKQKDFQKAIDSYTIAAVKSQDEQLEQKAIFGIGNAKFHMGKLKEAVGAYKKVLEINPKNEKAKKNLAYTLREIKKQQKKEQDTKKKRQKNKNQDKKQNKDQKQNQKGQDQQKKDGQNKKKDQKNGDKKDKKQNQQQKKKDKKKGGAPKKFSSKKMSEQEAKKWLKSLDEKKNRKKHRMNAMPRGTYHNEKDW